MVRDFKDTNHITPGTLDDLSAANEGSTPLFRIRSAPSIDFTYLHWREENRQTQNESIAKDRGTLARIVHVNDLERAS
jgi:hypothetical protein